MQKKHRLYIKDISDDNKKKEKQARKQVKTVDRAYFALWTYDVCKKSGRQQRRQAATPEKAATLTR